MPVGIDLCVDLPALTCSDPSQMPELNPSQRISELNASQGWSDLSESEASDDPEPEPTNRDIFDKMSKNPKLVYEMQWAAGDDSWWPFRVLELKLEDNSVLVEWISDDDEDMVLDIDDANIGRIRSGFFSIDGIVEASSTQTPETYSDSDHGLTYEVSTLYKGGSTADVSWTEKDIQDEKILFHNFRKLIYKYWDAHDTGPGWRDELFEAATGSVNECTKVLKSATVVTEATAQVPAWTHGTKDELRVDTFTRQRCVCNRCRNDIWPIKKGARATFFGALRAKKWPGGEAYDIDHIVPTKWGGLCTRDNLQMLCKRCHRVKTSIEALFNGQLGLAMRAMWPERVEFLDNAIVHQWLDPVSARPGVYTALWELHEKLWHLVCPIKKIAVSIEGASIGADKTIRVQVKFCDPGVILADGAPYNWPHARVTVMDALNDRHTRRLIRDDTSTRLILFKSGPVIREGIDKVIAQWTKCNLRASSVLPLPKLPWISLADKDKKLQLKREHRYGAPKDAPPPKRINEG